MVATLRLGQAGHERGVAHVAIWCGAGSWRSRCNGIGASSHTGEPELPWPTMREAPSWQHKDGRLVTMEWDPEPGPRLCRRCLARIAYERDELARFLAARGLSLSALR